MFDLYEEEHILEHVLRVGDYLTGRLNELVQKYEFLKERRGKGMIQGLEVTGRPVGEIVNHALENGLVLMTAGNNVLRFVPPLVITEEDVDCMLEKLQKSF